MEIKTHIIGNLIWDALTKEQVVLLLDVLALSGKLNDFIDDFQRIDPDMAVSLSKILKQTGAKVSDIADSRITSRGRLLKDWNLLWNKWRICITEVGDEEGKYAVQDVHWEPPYFNPYILAEDLEPIAADMLTLIDDVYESVKQPKLFFDAIDEIGEKIAQYPEWMGVEYADHCILGKNVTRCVLMWLWLSIKNDPVPGSIMVDKMCDIQEAYSTVALDSDEWVDFFIKLPDEVCRDIYDYLVHEDYRFDLDDVFSPWHSIHLQLESRFNFTKYLASCRKHLSLNWRYGRPLVEDAFKQKDYQVAESWLMRTFTTYLGMKKKKTWYPETSLLLSQCDFFVDDDTGEIVELLKLWANVSRRMGNLTRGAAAELQMVTMLSPENWDNVIQEYKRLATPKTKTEIQPLFNQWKTAMAMRSLPYHEVTVKNLDTWIHWLIEAGLDVNGKRRWFRNTLNRWLDGLEQDGNTFRKQWLWLAQLTCDLQSDKKIFPSFYEAAIPGDNPIGSILEKSRRGGLQKMNVGSCLDLMMKVWKLHLILIIPDPAAVHKSDYSRHAIWAKALYELNPDAYDKLLARWQKKHNRRRNLWRDMKAVGLPI
jgi:hypothetical protein